MAEAKTMHSKGKQLNTFQSDAFGGILGCVDFPLKDNVEGTQMNHHHQVLLQMKKTRRIEIGWNGERYQMGYRR
ncbi:hypothetical protein CDL15_Pgr008861 [Punica granatum]|uniref:Uncharacterized protein n=1 Tax=Punica granatum TaxID=22663 RepID=A0A218VZ22_PUNGR|nr:hypothetical protein CDL15_Pgr008861 [Punica granatum]